MPAGCQLSILSSMTYRVEVHSRAVLAELVRDPRDTGPSRQVKYCSVILRAALILDIAAVLPDA